NLTPPPSPPHPPPPPPPTTQRLTFAHSSRPEGFARAPPPTHPSYLRYPFSFTQIVKPFGSSVSTAKSPLSHPNRSGIIHIRMLMGGALYLPIALRTFISRRGGASCPPVAFAHRIIQPCRGGA